MKNIKETKFKLNRGYLDTPQAHLYYEVVGKGIPILLLHGNSQSHHVFHSYARKLQQSYQVILMDSRGHGHSHTTGSSADALFSIGDMAQDSAKLLDHLGIVQAILFGFSDGANIALEFASRFPERTLAVISASGNALPYGLRLPIRIGTQMIGSVLSFVKTLLPDSPLRERFINQWQLNTLLTDSPNLPAERLQKIQAPVLLLAGTKDLIKTSHTRWMAEQIPHSQLCLLEGGTHQVLFLREQLCLSYILSFLKEKGLSPS